MGVKGGTEGGGIGGGLGCHREKKVGKKQIEEKSRDHANKRADIGFGVGGEGVGGTLWG